MPTDLKEVALGLHRLPKPFKLEIQPTKLLANQYNMALAFSRRVAHAGIRIANELATAYDYTECGNFVAIFPRQADSS